MLDAVLTNEKPRKIFHLAEDLLVCFCLSRVEKVPWCAVACTYTTIKASVSVLQWLFGRKSRKLMMMD